MRERLSGFLVYVYLHHVESVINMQEHSRRAKKNV